MGRWLLVPVLLLVPTVVQAQSPAAPARIEVFPAKVLLDATHQPMHLVVTGIAGDERRSDLTAAAQIVSSNPAVARIEDRLVYPVKDGTAEILVTAAGLQSKVPVIVSRQSRPEPVSFEYGVLAALNKAGCNSGGCHGAPQGKGGFRLSLRGFDPELDAFTLVREGLGRRTNRIDPHASLILQKGLAQTPHAGGKRFGPRDAAYLTLLSWIEQGCRSDLTDHPRCSRIEVYPRTRVLHQPADRQQLVVLAYFADGSVRDVTHLAVYSSSAPSVADADERGLITARGHGETALTVRYMDKIESVEFTFLTDLPNFAWQDAPEHNYIDRAVNGKLRQLKIQPSNLCSDEEFIRRVYLDVSGLLPEPAETQKFLADAAPDKRAKLIDRLLDEPAFAAHWAQKWGDLMRLRLAKVPLPALVKTHDWLTRSFRQDQSYDQFVRELLTASGDGFENSPVNFLLPAVSLEGQTYKVDASDLAETTARLFLGARIQCAKCHNHPFEQWTQDNFYGLQAIFQRLQAVHKSGSREQGNLQLILWTAREGEAIQPRTGKQVKPWLPLVGSMDVPPRQDRRELLADWLCRPENPLLARVEVNRIWKFLLGQGIVEPIDDFRASNPPSNRQLLDALAEDFVKNRFSRKHMIRTILNSHTYQRSSRTNEWNKEDERYASHALVRRLSAEQLVDGIGRVTGSGLRFGTQQMRLPAGTAATQLPSPDFAGGLADFLTTFGQPQRSEACECERSNESNRGQALELLTGGDLHSLIQTGGRLTKLLNEKKSDEEIIAELYLAALCRKPRASEVTAAVKYVRASAERVRGLHGVCWALLNTREFLFQH